MIRLSIRFILLLCLCAMTWGCSILSSVPLPTSTAANTSEVQSHLNKSMTIELNTSERKKTANLGFGLITFDFIGQVGNDAQVMVSIENTIQNSNSAIVIFKQKSTESILTKNKDPKFKISNKIIGKKGEREIRGFRDIKSKYVIIPCAKIDTVLTLDVSFTSDKTVTIPFYIAKYNPNKLSKKGVMNISYEIEDNPTCEFTIKVVGWSKDDPTYVKIKESVDSFISSLKGVKFCPNPAHRIGLNEQQKKYRDIQESLIRTIKGIDKTHGWMTDTQQSIAYNELLSQLENIDFNNYIKDCGQHKRTHNCRYCKLSAQEIFHQIEDTYQDLYSGTLSREDAVKKAKALYDCYKKNNSRKRDNVYGEKISTYYESINKY